MSSLEQSGVLEERLKNIECSDELKAEINSFINIEKRKIDGFDNRFSNLLYRSNLHYIEDNINKTGLVEELKEHIKKTNSN